MQLQAAPMEQPPLLPLASITMALHPQHSSLPPTPVSTPIPAQQSPLLHDGPGLSRPPLTDRFILAKNSLVTYLTSLHVLQFLSPDFLPYID